MTTTIDKVSVTRLNDLHYTVRVEGKRRRTFKGETAWSDAQRYANDMLLETRGTPFGEGFIL